MDPSMLIGFLMRDEDDWYKWRHEVENMHGKTIIHIADNDPALLGLGGERDAAIDEVESFDDDEDDDGVTVLDD
jgi:cysteine protease ATG4